SALSSAAAASGTELLALLIFLFVARASESVAELWAAFSASLLVSLGYLVAAAIFGLDSVQLRARVPAEQIHRFDITVLWTLARFGIVELVSLTLAACALAAARLLQRGHHTSNRL